jgi:hypothetical protein
MWEHLLLIIIITIIIIIILILIIIIILLLLIGVQQKSKLMILYGTTCLRVEIIDQGYIDFVNSKDYGSIVAKKI